MSHCLGICPDKQPNVTVLNFIPLFIIVSLWTTYTLSIEPQRAVEDEDRFVSTLFQMYSLHAQGESNVIQFFGHLPPALDFQSTLEG